MNKKQIIELLEEEYCKELQKMDIMNVGAIQERKNAANTADPVDAAYYEELAKRNQAEAQAHASVCCKLIDILATINGLTIEHQTTEMHKKYDLY